MSEAKLRHARALIKQKEYQQARVILQTISDNPTAKQWLLKLDEIAPVVEKKADHNMILKLASQLLKQQEWYKARELLEPINDNPTAARWLAKLNEIAPEPDFSIPITSKPTSKSPQKFSLPIPLSTPIVIAVVVITVVIAIVVFALLVSGSSSIVAQRVEDYCIAYSTTDPRISGFNPTGFCDQWAVENANDRRVQACHNQSPELDTPFMQCLAAEGFMPEPEYIQSYEFLLIASYGACARYSGEDFDSGTFAMPLWNIFTTSECGSWAFTVAFEYETMICARQHCNTTSQDAYAYASGGMDIDIFDTTEFENCLRQQGVDLPDIMQ